MSRVSVAAPLMLVVGGSLVYHIAAKSVPKALDPVASVIGVYAAALLGSMAVYAAARPGSLPGGARLWHRAIVPLEVLDPAGQHLSNHFVIGAQSAALILRHQLFVVGTA